jgi:hypothetical protein
MTLKESVQKTRCFQDNAGDRMGLFGIEREKQQKGWEREKERGSGKEGNKEGNKQRQRREVNVLLERDFRNMGSTHQSNERRSENRRGSARKNIAEARYE